ncbi:MAG: NADP-dependent oxidoreductase [Casimicrobiaceae bacterium]
MKNQRIVLASRPAGFPAAENFRLEEVDLEPLAAGEVRVRHHYLSLDPYMRGRMNEGKSYADAQPLDQTMIGGTVGEVVESRHPRFAVGDRVVGMGGWQLYSTARGDGELRKVDDSVIPLTAYLGAVGMPGMTAWYGLMQIIAPRPGETICVDAASGAVGSVVGQLAKLKGCRAVGIAGGADKCRYLTEELGFDAAIDYKAYPEPKAIYQALKAATPSGIDGHFENVGGAIFDAVMLRMNAHGRIAVCGMISGYNGEPIPMAAPQLILVSRLKVQGFIVSEHMELWPTGLRELAEHVAAGRIKYRESIAQGLENAPQAFFDLLRGRNFGKQLVKLL